ncbi:MAG: MlaD family protein [Burkholderiaceae bacterium]
MARPPEPPRSGADGTPDARPPTPGADPTTPGADPSAPDASPAAAGATPPAPGTDDGATSAAAANTAAADATTAAATDEPETLVARGQPIRRRPMQLVWILPLVAAIIGGWIFVQSVLNKGPKITISFSNAEGLEVGKTRIKYRDVDIGTVNHIGFDESFKMVRVTAELTRSAAPLLVEDTRFWVVRPRVGAGGVSGLGTLLSGAYIDMDVGRSHESRREYEGLDKPPTVTADLPGRRFSLRADTAGSLGIGSPVYYRRVQVGRVTSVELDDHGGGVIIEIFVDSPYERFVTRRSRFWEASGIDIALDAGGFRVNTQSAASILAGGVSFATAPGEGADVAAEEGAQFRMAGDQGAAMKETETETLNVRMYFSESLRGLSPGAPVDFRGVVVGEVRTIGVEFDPKSRTFRFPVDVQLYPARVMPPRPASTSDAAARESIDQVLATLIDGGFRAQLRPGNLLTGQLYIALDFFPRSRKATLTRHRNNVVEIPTIGGSLGEFQASISDLLARINRIPFDGIAADLRQTLRQGSATLEATRQTVTTLQQTVDTMGRDLPPEMLNTLGELRQTMADVRRVVDNAGQSLAHDSALQTDLRGALREVNRAAGSLRQLTDYLERHPEALLRGKPGDAE